jgi:methyl acetate hydrolase
MPHMGGVDGTRMLAESTVATMGQNAMGDLRCRAMKSVAPGSTNDVDFLGRDAVGSELPDQSQRSCRPVAWLDRWHGPDSPILITGLIRRSRRLASTRQQLLPFFVAKALVLFGASEAEVYESWPATSGA